MADSHSFTVSNWTKPDIYDCSKNPGRQNETLLTPGFFIVIRDASVL